MWIERRKVAYWRTDQMFLAQNDLAAPDGVALTVRSDFFLVQSRIRLERATLSALSLMQRGRNTESFATTVLWSRLN